MDTESLRERWQPLRGGLINLFKFEDQVFRYQDGRLLLRGDNGSGKSRVLALQLPFLLDGEVSPHRVEPDRDPAKRMEWHLLMDRYERRTGYTWIEFGRLEDGEPRYLTLGCGMEAQQGAGSPQKWFFVSPRRVEDLALVRDRVPLGRRQLMASFEERGHGTVFDKASEYRAAVDDALFKLGGRYGPLIELLIQLRQPQLMREMKEDALSKALSEALTPVGEGLVHEVAESFQGLDGDRRQYEEHREMLDSVEVFRDEYRRYLGVSVRRLCEIVRSDHSRYEHAVRDLRQIEQEIDGNRARLAGAEENARDLHQRRAALEAEVAALRDSPEMRTKRELEETLRRADECEAAAGDAAAEWESADQARIRAADELREAADRQAAQRGEVDGLHQALAGVWLDIAAPETALFDWPPADPAAERARMDQFVSGRKRAIVHLRDCNAEIDRRREDWGRARDALAHCRSAVDAAGARVDQSEASLEAELARFGDAAAAWEGSLEILPASAFPRGRDWQREVAEWLEERTGASPLARRLGQARDQAHREIAAARSEAQARRREVEQALADLAHDLRRLREGFQPEPPPPAIRGDRPPDRPGAPLWRWCEFRPEIPDAEHAGWEAALESSGLLDAWVFPDGTLADGEWIDDFLVGDGGARLETSASLAAILRAAPGGEAVEGVLRCIGNHRGAGRCWVDRDGSWANHVHTGRGWKPDAEYLGHPAREAARTRRIAAVEDQQEQLQARADDLEEQIGRLDRRMDLLSAECDAAPSTRRLEDAAIVLQRDREALQEQKTLAIGTEQRVLDAEQEVHRSVAHRDADAEDLGLAPWRDPDRLKELADGVDQFEKQAIAFWPACRLLGKLEEDARRAETRKRAAAETATRLAARRDEQADLATRARARAETLRAAVGATVAELMERLARAEEAAAQTRRDGEQAEEAVQGLRIEAARLDERRTAARERREATESGRDHAVGRMATFAEERIFAELDPALQPERAAFSATAAVELARRLEQGLQDHPADEETWNRLQSQLTQSFNELTDQLGRHGHHPLLRSVDESSTHVITCEYQGRSRTMSELHRVLVEELRSRERIFEEREREVIENHLIGEAAIELQKRIRDGEEWVLGVNDELDHVRTSSGIQLRFSWDLAEPDDEALKTIRRLFLKTSATWTPAERDTIGQFLHDRIRAAREADDTVGWRDHLARALDYRAWHRFSILRRQSGETAWKKLTKRTFGTGSGGEKALTLTVPRFAAAAAHYRSAGPHAPRLILLDEAFVAIDAPTRARLMGLLETFDLDYVMTSEREWGTYPTVSALAIYQLATRPGYRAIAVTRWVWNGREKVRDTTGNENGVAIARVWDG